MVTPLGELDAVLIEDVHTGKAELRHRGCVGMGEPLKGPLARPLGIEED